MLRPHQSITAHLRTPEHRLRKSPPLPTPVVLGLVPTGGFRLVETSKARNTKSRGPREGCRRRTERKTCGPGSGTAASRTPPARERPTGGARGIRPPPGVVRDAGNPPLLGRPTLAAAGRRLHPAQFTSAT